MKFFVTGVGGQLGHDVMNELHKRGYEAVGSDVAPAYSGVDDGSAVVSMPYVSLDITDADASVSSLRSYLVSNLMTALPNRRNLTTTGFNRNVFKL